MDESIDELALRFPARQGYLGVCRINASTIAASAGFDLDELDDLRLAVNEAVSWLLTDETDGGFVELTLWGGDSDITCLASRTEEGLPARVPTDLANAILGATVDSFEHGVDAEGRRFVKLAKRRSDG